jgi:hypothetical protein
MKPDESEKLIATAGGNVKFAELLGIQNEPGYQQRVNNWKRRGIPAAVVLEHHDVFRSLSAAAAAQSNAA